MNLAERESMILYVVEEERDTNQSIVQFVHNVLAYMALKTMNRMYMKQTLECLMTLLRRNANAEQRIHTYTHTQAHALGGAHCEF